ncbi:hypothetical protein [Streptomyces sp900129855]|uniref:Uncharacterized protein n=1 Tax=Streptomyces sp. 900129855 TaxID=3155129 RepID=A0ABV2ZX80_9ACTN
MTPQRVPLGALDDWLYEAKPKADCARCADEKAKLDEAAKSGDANARFDAARNIRQCKHGARA